MLQTISVATQLVRTNAVLAIATILLAGCIFLPQTAMHYNAECDIDERKMTLEAQQLASLVNCVNDGCVAILVAAGVVSAATAVVSGSVVVVGNVVYWLEEKGQCWRAKPKSEGS